MIISTLLFKISLMYIFIVFTMSRNSKVLQFPPVVAVICYVEEDEVVLVGLEFALCVTCRLLVGTEVDVVVSACRICFVCVD